MQVGIQMQLKGSKLGAQKHLRLSDSLSSNSRTTLLATLTPSPKGVAVVGWGTIAQNWNVNGESDKPPQIFEYPSLEHTVTVIS